MFVINVCICITSCTMPKRNVACAFSYTINCWLLPCLSFFLQRFERRRPMAGKCVCKCVCMRTRPLPLSSPSSGTYVFLLAPVAPNCPTQIWRGYLCHFLCEWREAPLQCEPPLVAALSLWVVLLRAACVCAEEHCTPAWHDVNSTTTLNTSCRSTHLYSLVCNTCTILTAACSTLYTL